MMAEHPKPKELPNGWIEAISKRHPKLVYYFNTFTGASSWTCPQFIVASADSSSPDDLKNKKSNMKKVGESCVTVTSTPEVPVNVATSPVSPQETKSLLPKEKCVRFSDQTVLLSPRLQRDDCANNLCDSSDQQELTQALGPPAKRPRIKRSLLPPVGNSDTSKIAEPEPEKQCRRKRTFSCIAPSVSQPVQETAVDVLSDVAAFCKQKPISERKDVEAADTGQHLEHNRRTLIDEHVAEIRRILTSKRPVKPKCDVKKPSEPSSKVNTNSLRKTIVARRSTPQVPENSPISKNNMPSVLRSAHTPQTSVVPHSPEKPRRIIRLKQASPPSHPLLNSLTHVSPVSRAQENSAVQSLPSSLQIQVSANANSPIISQKFKHVISPRTSPLEKMVVTPEDSSVSDVEMQDVSREVCLEDLQEVTKTDKKSISNPQGFFIVVDTNILIYDLKYLDELKDLPLQGRGPPNIIVPWMVIQELDGLKQGAKSGMSGSPSGNCTRKASEAIRYLHAMFTANHPRIIGQTAMEAKENQAELKTECNDDRILQCCLSLRKEVAEEQVILLSNDKNLCVKALIHGIKAYTSETLLKDIQVDFVKYQPTVQENLTKSSSPKKEENSLRMEVDSIMCEMKVLLKEALTPVLESEMKEAYGDMWPKIVIRQPPWSLLDILECFKRHWIAVFTFLFDHDVKYLIEELYQNLRNCKGYIYNHNDASSWLRWASELCINLAPRYKPVEEKVPRMKELVEFCQQLGQDTQANLGVNGEASTGQHELQEKVFVTFQFVWDTIHHHCGITSDVLGHEHNFQYQKPDVLPSRDQAILFLPTFFPKVRILKKQMEAFLHIDREPGTVGDTTYNRCLSEFYNTLVNFVPKLGVSHKPPPAPVTFQMMNTFCSNPLNRELLQNGYRQLLDMYTSLHGCILQTKRLLSS